jgi:hypothetical protein
MMAMFAPHSHFSANGRRHGVDPVVIERLGTVGDAGWMAIEPGCGWGEPG